LEGMVYQISLKPPTLLTSYMFSVSDFC